MKTYKPLRRQKPVPHAKDNDLPERVEIQLAQPGIKAIVDRTDALQVWKLHWRLHNGVPITSIRIDDCWKPISLACFILGVDADVCYRDGNTLNNSRANLQLLSAASKTCSRCGNKKELQEFHKDRTAPDGRCAKCKNCKNLLERLRKHSL